jgi:hypothetical protein
MTALPRRVKWFIQHGHPRAPHRKRLVLRYFRRLAKVVRAEEEESWARALQRCLRTTAK